MTDRELLELAAKAVGYDTSHHWNAERMNMEPSVIGLCIPNVSTCWNPLEDSGHALDLAVKLRIDICTDENDPHPTENRQICHVNAWPRNAAGCSEDCYPDPYAATRRAIVRAAAEIGKEIDDRKDWSKE